MEIIKEEITNSYQGEEKPINEAQQNIQEKNYSKGFDIKNIFSIMNDSFNKNPQNNEPNIEKLKLVNEIQINTYTYKVFFRYIVNVIHIAAKRRIIYGLLKIRSTVKKPIKKLQYKFQSQAYRNIPGNLVFELMMISFLKLLNKGLFRKKLRAFTNFYFNTRKNKFKSILFQLRRVFYLKLQNVFFRFKCLLNKDSLVDKYLFLKDINLLSKKNCLIKKIEFIIFMNKLFALNCIKKQTNYISKSKKYKKIYSIQIQMNVSNLFYIIFDLVEENKKKAVQKWRYFTRINRLKEAGKLKSVLEAITDNIQRIESDGLRNRFYMWQLM